MLGVRIAIHADPARSRGYRLSVFETLSDREDVRVANLAGAGRAFARALISGPASRRRRSPDDEDATKVSERWQSFW